MDKEGGMAFAIIILVVLTFIGWGCYSDVEEYNQELLKDYEELEAEHEELKTKYDELFREFEDFQEYGFQ